MINYMVSLPVGLVASSPGVILECPSHCALHRPRTSTLLIIPPQSFVMTLGPYFQMVGCPGFRNSGLGPVSFSLHIFPITDKHLF